MIGGLRVKVCGLTTVEDAVAAAGIGADYLGFILHPKSPRYLPLERFVALRPRLPVLPQVAVMVAPTIHEVEAALGAGFDFLQIHFSDTDTEAVRVAAARAGAARLWLAPKLPPEAEVPAAALELARTWLLDTYQASGFGGTGRTGDWAKFRRHREAHPEKCWVLAGGLSPANIGDAVAATGAELLDVNSGVEAAPGRKDPAKLAALRAALETRAC